MPNQPEPDFNLMKTDLISDKLKLLKQIDASMTHIIYRDANGKPIAAAIFVTGQETDEILEAVKIVEDSWI